MALEIKQNEVLLLLTVTVVVLTSVNAHQADGSDVTSIRRADNITLDTLYVLVQHQAEIIQQQGVTIQQQGVTIQQQSAILYALEFKMAALESSSASLQTLQSRVTSLESELASVKGLIAAVTREVAFTVTFATDTASGVSLSNHEILQFDHVITNIGLGYNTNTGIFTAPVAGVYAFFLSVTSSNNHGLLILAIDKHGNILDYVYTEGSADSNDQGSSHVTTQMAAGEQLWVRQHAGVAVRGGSYTVFTGYLVQAD